jgi:carboxymethylenebutenolidase
VNDPGSATSLELNRRVFVGLGTSAAALGGTIAAALAAGEGFGKPHPPIVPEDDPAIAVERPALSSGIGAYAAFPTGDSQKTPGIVLVQHVWGVDATIRDDVRRFAKEGFVAIAPELYARMHPPSGDGLSDYTVFRPFAQRLDDEQVQDDLQAAADWIRRRAGVAPNARPPKVGITGFCMGGGIALRQTWANPKPYDAAAIWYGSVTDQNADFVALPVEGNFGGRDTSISPADVRAFFARLKVPHDLKIYEEAGHAFFDDTRSSYVPSAAADAWSRTLAFFRTYLRA